MTKIIAHWYGDYEEWDFDDELLDDHDPTSGAFVFDVPDELWASRQAAVKELDITARELIEAGCLSRDCPELAQACGAYQGESRVVTIGDKQFDMAPRCSMCGHEREDHES